MNLYHNSFWMDFLGRIGAPIFAATLVGCLLAEQFAFIHGLLLLIGISFMGISHWHEYHQTKKI
jgi:hypothetical protein